MQITDSSVKMTYRCLADASPPTYFIKYRKVGSDSWEQTEESTSTHLWEWETVSGLEANTEYEFRVVAKSEGESPAIESKSALVKTTI